MLKSNQVKAKIKQLSFVSNTTYTRAFSHKFSVDPPHAVVKKSVTETTN